LLAVVTCVLGAIFGDVVWLLPLGLFVVSLLCDLGMYRFVARYRSPRILACFIGAQFLFNFSVGAGISVGCLQWLVSSKFRTLYDQETAAHELVPFGGARRESH
jgi:hypothetical protein